MPAFGSPHANSTPPKPRGLWAARPSKPPANVTTRISGSIPGEQMKQAEEAGQPPRPAPAPPGSREEAAGRLADGPVCAPVPRVAWHPGMRDEDVDALEREITD